MEHTLDEGVVAEPPAAAVTSLGEVLWAGLGIGCLAVAVAAGASGDPVASAASAPDIAAPGIGAFVLTAPAIAVVHQYLRIHSPVASVVDALARGFADCGRLAMGFSPFALYLSVTAPGSSSVLALLLGAMAAGTGLTVGGIRLVQLAPTDGRWVLAVLCWAAVTVAVALRLIVNAVFGA